MIRLFRPWGVALLLAFTSAVYATWVGGRGPGNAGAFPDTPFPAAPATMWKAFLGPDCVGTTPTNTVLAGKTLIVAYGAKLYAVAAATGEVRWKQDLPAEPLGELLLLDDQVIVTTTDNGVHAYNTADGSEAWQHAIVSSVQNSPLYSDDALLLATRGGNFEVIARKTGKTLATVDVPGTLAASPLLMGKSIVLCFTSGNLMRLDNGANRWSVSIPNASFTQNPMNNGQSILVSSGTALFSLNTNSISSPVRWAFTREGLLPVSAAVDAKVVYVVAADRLFALDAATGAPLWDKDGLVLPAPAVDAPVVIGDVVLVRMQSGLLAAYGKNSGKLLWNYRTTISGRSDVQAGLPVVAGRDLYFAASDGQVYHLAAQMLDTDPPTFSKVLPTLAGTDFAGPASLRAVGAIVEDEGCGLATGSVTIQLDETDLTGTMRVDAATGYYYAPLGQTPLQPGRHRLTMTAQDNRGNTGTLTAAFYVGNAATIERVPITINGEFLPSTLRVRPGTILEWVNSAGGPRTVIADNMAFTSDTQYPEGIPQEEHWVWVVPANAPVGTKYYYHCRLYGEAGTGNEVGPGLAGVIEIVDPKRDVPGVPRVKGNPLPAFPIPDFFK